MATPHNWSGFPGAWCLDCGVECQGELCIADCAMATQCELGHEMCDEHPPWKCRVHVSGPCPEPGSGRHNPYLSGTSTK